MGRKEVIMAVQEALKRGPFSLRDLAGDAGVGYETLRQWAAGARNPRQENIDSILAALDGQADRIKELVRSAREAE